jgi:hypothetical protein
MIKLGKLFRGTRLDQKRARQQRLVNYQFAVRVAFRAKAKAKYGIGVRGDTAAIENDRRLLRNARKKERQARS